MARLIRARVLLCTLVFGFQAVLAQTTGFNFPPEDLDSSGDDDDSFSGSGAGSLPSVSAWDVPLQESINTSSSPSVAPDVGDHDPEAQGTTETTSEDYQRIPVSPTNMHVFLVNGLMTDKPVGSVEEEVGVFTEQAVTSSAVVTARVPVTHHTYTVRTTTSQASSTVGVIEPVVYHDLYHEVSSNDKEEPASDIVPTINSLDATSSTTTSLVFIKDTSSQPEEGILPPEDGSGDQGDFMFGGTDEKAEIETEIRPVEETGAGSRSLHPGTHDTKSAGASQGLMDRKDVLAGVIAGGLVGLLFAGFLVGFMLYRMKKKDEGSYSLDEPKQSNGGYQKPHKQEEFYA
ncbi:PREDICTED: syndecan-1 [Gekko japonicus]|uniref:Syndecan n=1 Tax=Gekko japonicus TaxID=146911 RepID=A0ABM1JHG1_GEKJA|nr:PREDICTED: syndecan-1 [Gekko japonicus]